jgi:hypothetical protein
MKTSCDTCGQHYDRDPVLEVACPCCDASVGRPCVSRRPSEHVHSTAFSGLPSWGHDVRDLLAAAEGHYYCGCGITPAEARRRLEILLLRGPKARWRDVPADEQRAPEQLELLGAA